jgi:PAS domain S-box-containing protein
MPAMASPGQGSERLNAQLLVDSIPALIHTARPDGYLDYFNKPWLEYLGVTLDQVTGWNWTAYVHPEDVEGIVAKWRACLATGEIFEYETRVRSASGEYRWMLHRKVPLRDANGNIVKWYGSSLDIDERKTAEEHLRRNAQKLQRSEFYLVEGQRLARMGSWAFDRDGFDYWSPELFRIYGLDPARKPPSVQEYLDRVHPQDREFMANLIEGVLAKASPFDATKRIVRPDGEVRYIRCVGGPVVENQNLKKYVGSALDVTEHELLAQELRRREAYLTEAQRLSQTGSFGWRPDTGEIAWSEETYRIFGYNPAEKPTMNMVLERIHPQDRVLARQLIEDASKSGTDFEHEYRLVMPGGAIKHVHVRAHAIHDSSGNNEFVGAVTDVTEQRHAEAVIRGQEAELREVVDTIPSIVWSALPDGSNSYANSRFVEYCGMPPDQIAGSGWQAATHPDDLERTNAKWLACVASGEPFEDEVRFRRADGQYRWYLSRGIPLRDEVGHIVKWYGVVTDIEDRKRAEEALQSSEAYLAEAQRLAHMGSWVWQVGGKDALHLSDEWYRIYGFDPKQGMPEWEERLQRVHPADRGKWQGTIERAIRERSNYDVEFRILLSDGSIKWVQTVGRPVFSTAGELVQFVGSSMDVTERKAAEDRIRAQEAELRQILDLAPQHVHVLAADARLVYTNEVALKYHGPELEEWQLRPLDQWQIDELPFAAFHPDDRERMMIELQSKFLSGSAHEAEARLLRHDGKYRWFLFRFSPLRDAQGRVMRWYVAGTDIEDRKQSEERLRHENVALREEIDKASMFEEIVGTSPALKSVLSRISKVAPSDSTVLITGETGTGKELVARAIHRRSDRASRAFVSVNCAAIPRDLIASELFGHEKGAFTGATQQRLGRFEMANGGTIFLDEVGELPAETQIALLRVLQEHEFERVGGTRRIRADVRVIAATNRDLQAAISAGTFRSDLFYRLHVFPVELPSLRERNTDIPLLVEYFIDRYARKAGKNIRGVNKKALQLLQSYPWPGNIRELQNVIERSVILCETEIFSIDESWLPKQPSLTEPKNQMELSRSLLAQEREMIEAALKESRGRIFGPKGAAAKLGIPRSTLESKIRSLKIDKNRFRPIPGT